MSDENESNIFKEDVKRVIEAVLSSLNKSGSCVRAFRVKGREDQLVVCDDFGDVTVTFTKSRA